MGVLLGVLGRETRAAVLPAFPGFCFIGCQAHCTIARVFYCKENTATRLGVTGHGLTRHYIYIYIYNRN